MLQAVARRRQRRGNVGCTNIGGHRDDQDDKAQHVQQRERPKGGGGDSSDHGCEAERRHAAKKQQQNARKKLVLPLLQSASSMSSSSGSGERERDGNGSTDGQHVEVRRMVDISDTLYLVAISLCVLRVEGSVLMGCFLLPCLTRSA